MDTSLRMRLDGGGVLRMRVRTREAANCAGVLGWRDFSEAAAEVTAQAAGGAPGLEGAAAVAQDVAARPLAAEGDLRARISGTEAAAGLASRGQEVADLPRDTIRVAPAPVSLASDLSAQPRPVAAPRQPALGDPGRCGLLRVRGIPRAGRTSRWGRPVFGSGGLDCRLVLEGWGWVTGVGSDFTSAPAPPAAPSGPGFCPSELQFPYQQGGINDSIYRAVKRIKWDNEIMMQIKRLCSHIHSSWHRISA